MILDFDVFKKRKEEIEAKERFDKFLDKTLKPRFILITFIESLN